MTDPNQPPQEEAPQIEIDWSDEPLPVYSNGAQIVHSHREFAVAFTDFAPFSGRRPKPYPPRPGEVHERARVVSAVRMTPDVFFQLIAAGAPNWNKFVERYGAATGQSMPTFRLEGEAVAPGLTADQPES
ncbi:MAG: DUF3467 domain-containing protein [Sandaracinaceae bacterium]